VGAGVSDLRIFYTLGAGSSVKPTSATPAPWDEVEYYHKASPLTYVKGAQTPTLIQHGERDNTAPIAGAQELYRALKDQGVTTRMIVYRGAGHLPNGLKQFETSRPTISIGS
jgi:prolyl oligopeptidase